jgi:Putative archaeal flagellar protein F
MGIEVSASYAVVALGLLICIGILFGAGSNASERVTDALEDERKQVQGTYQTDITITNADYRGDMLVVSIKNTGDTELLISRTDLLVDGEYIADRDRTTTVSGGDSTDLWMPGETLELSVVLQEPDRVKIITEYGIAATELVDTFSLTANVAFTNASSSLYSYGIDNQYRDFTGTAMAVGPPLSNFVRENSREIPSVNTSGDVVITTASGDRTVLTSNAKSGSTKLAAGRWQGSEPSVFYVDSDTGNISRVTSDGTATEITANSDIDAQGVAGLGDIDGDGSNELIYGGNGPDGTSNSVIYVDDGGSIVGTDVGYGTNNGIGLGEPADFNGDGTVRVPYVDGSNNILLVDQNGGTTQLTSSGVAVKAPMATGDFDSDELLEIYFVGTDSGQLRVLDNATVDNTVKTVTNDQGASITVDNDAGVS